MRAFPAPDAGSAAEQTEAQQDFIETLVWQGVCPVCDPGVIVQL